MKTLSSYKQFAKHIVLEADKSDDYVHIGYGKYKEKDPSTGEAKADSPVYTKDDSETFKKDDSGKFSPAGGEKGGEEVPDSHKISGAGEFERPKDTKQDVDSDMYAQDTWDRQSGDKPIQTLDTTMLDDVLGKPQMADKPEYEDWEVDDVILDLEDAGDYGPYIKALKSAKGNSSKIHDILIKVKEKSTKSATPEDDWTTDQVMTSKIGDEEVGDIIDNEDHYIGKDGEICGQNKYVSLPMLNAQNVFFFVIFGYLFCIFFVF